VGIAVIPPGTPFAAIERAVVEAVALYEREAFSIQRQLYDEDENLCQVVETAIWVSHYLCKAYFEDHNDQILFFN
jgi:hypothetical protein